MLFFCLPACVSQRNGDPGHPQMESAAPQETIAGAEVSSTDLTKAHCHYVYGNISLCFLICRYLHKPYLIGGNKFDLRIYVYVTSYEPLRIYLFSDGLVRFASCKWEWTTSCWVMWAGTDPHWGSGSVSLQVFVFHEDSKQQVHAPDQLQREQDELWVPDKQRWQGLPGTQMVTHRTFGECVGVEPDLIVCSITITEDTWMKYLVGFFIVFASYA